MERNLEFLIGCMDDLSSEQNKVFSFWQNNYLIIFVRLQNLYFYWMSFSKFSSNIITATSQGSSHSRLHGFKREGRKMPICSQYCSVILPWLFELLRKFFIVYWLRVYCSFTLTPWYFVLVQAREHGEKSCWWGTIAWRRSVQSHLQAHSWAITIGGLSCHQSDL